MTIEKMLNGSELNITVSGRLDTTTAPRLEAELNETLDGVEKLVLEVLPRMSSVQALGIEDLGAYLNARVAEINATLPSFERINKVIIRETDFVRTPAMKIARNLNGNKN